MKCLLYLMLTLFVSVRTTAQSNTVKGTITNDNGSTLPAASVIEKGTSNGTTTDQNGNFTINVQPNAVLVISSIGYETVDFPINGQTVVTIALVPSGKNLTDVVVIAYGAQRRSTLTSSQSSISAKDFEGQPVTRLDQALQGRSTGVLVTNTSGAPGSDVRIRIRGANSINGDNGPLYVIDGFVGGDFNIINPDDVADIQILKDAAATAPYGSRGANGVIIVTTKKGSKGKASISFNTRQSSSDVVKKYNKLSAADYAEVVNLRRTLTGSTAYYTPDQVNNFKTNPVPDAQDAIYRRGIGQQYELGISGGSDKTNYYISGGYQDLQGIIVGSSYKFYNIRSNINAALTDKLSTYININGFIRTNKNTFLRAGTQNAVVESVAWSPSVGVYNNDGELVRTDPLGAQFYNPVAEAVNREALNDNYNANITGGLLYKIVNGLTFNVQYGIDYSTGEYKYFGDRYVSENVYGGRSTGTSLTLQNINTLNYKTTFKGVHNLDLTGVLELQKEKYSGFNIDIMNLVYPNFKWDNLTLADFSRAGAGYNSASLFSLFGRASYNYDERYLFTGTIRRDGSSRFRGNNKFSYFPSLAVGWVISKEKFMADQNLFNLLKLTASWGLTGNQAIGSYSTLSTYSALTTTLSPSTVVPAILIDRAANPDLKWETTEQKNLALEMGLLKSRLKARVDYFTKDTRDLLFWVGLPAYSGGGAIMRNVGNVQNKGWEFEIGGSPILNDNFSWNSSFNYSVVDNKIRTLADGKTEQTWDSDIGAGASVYPEFLLRVGQPMAAMYGLNYLGTWKPKDAAEAAKFNEKPGDSRYQDLNGDNVIDANDLTIIGYGLPKRTLGWNNTFTYKGLELNILLQGVYGFDKLNFIYAMGMTAYGDFRQPTLADIKNRYVPGVNETSDIPAFSTTNKNYVQSSRFISKGDFTRIKNVSLMYTLPKKLVKNIAAIRFFVGVTNLYTFTKYNGMDPEASNTSSSSDIGNGNSRSGDPAQSFDYGGYPIPRTYTGGLTLTF